MKKIYSQFILGDMNLQYILDTDTAIIGLRLFPADSTKKISEHTKTLSSTSENHTSECPDELNIEPLVLLHASKYPRAGNLSVGQTMRNGKFAELFIFDSQHIKETNTTKKILTKLKSKEGFEVIHTIEYEKKSSFLKSSAVFINNSNTSITLELFSSFSITGISPFQKNNAPEVYRIHRLRSSWSSEGTLITETAEQLKLENSWSNHSVQCERFGVIGSLPVMRWFPFISIEDNEHKVIWGAKVEGLSSWQIEIYRKDDFFALSGGLADREFGHWNKTIIPKEEFHSGNAWISVVHGKIEDITQRLTNTEIKNRIEINSNTELFPVFNEWCTTWGYPSEENLTPLLPVLKNLKIPYLIIDAGWYGNGEKNWYTSQGDWNENKKLYPKGLKAFCEKIRSFGITPGLWFEPESIGEDATIKNKIDWQLKLDGEPVKVGTRYFFDFRNTEVTNYLESKLSNLITECGLGYIKIDYNETIGLGCDSNNLPGEGLREHLYQVIKFFENLKKKFPQLIIENCASGGSRLCPAFVNTMDISSFSDAHECCSIPIIAGNLQFIIPPSKSLIWAVLHQTDSINRIYYSLAALFLGRICLSGRIDQLSEIQFSILHKALYLYSKISHIIQNGKSYRFGTVIKSYNHPKGWQVIVRYSKKREQCIIILHTFTLSQEEISILLPYNEKYQISESFCDPSVLCRINNNTIKIKGLINFTAGVWYLRGKF